MPVKKRNERVFFSRSPCHNQFTHSRQLPLPFVCEDAAGGILTQHRYASFRRESCKHGRLIISMSFLKYLFDKFHQLCESTKSYRLLWSRLINVAS